MLAYFGSNLIAEEAVYNVTSFEYLVRFNYIGNLYISNFYNDLPRKL